VTADIANEIADAFRDLREAFGVSVSYGGQEVLAIAEESEFARDLIEGGFRADAEVKTKALLADFTTLPAFGTVCSYRGATFKVSRVAIQPGSLVGEFVMTPRGR
jgi:hypothetical protein